MKRTATPVRTILLLGLGLGLVVGGSVSLTILAGARAANDTINVAVAPDAPASSEASAPIDTVIAVGDIGVCGKHDDELTARLVQQLPGPILALGDLAYAAGTEAEFERCFDPAWGGLRGRIHPVPGNHEYQTAGAGPYYEYFGGSAGTAGLGWYSFDIGEWHIIALNSNCETRTNFCSDDSPQGDWLESDLARHRNQCTLAIMHHPRWSSGDHGSDPMLSDLWTMLDDAGVEAVLAGHDHDYERFGAMDASGVADPATGMRQFVVGTGGRALDPFASVEPNSEARSNVDYGVLQLSLYADHYDWAFVPQTPGGYTDAGSDTCH